MSVLTEIRRAFSEHALMNGDTTILVGVSGGVDSFVLLHALTQLTDLGVNLVAATLDHGLRGDVGAADARFVEETVNLWGIPCERAAVDVAALAAQRHMSIEQAARHARYRFFAQIAQKLGIQRVAVAHHADDQTETVLFHLLRGSGISGLRGMAWSAPLPGHPDLVLIRPLLGVRRADIEAYAHEHGLSPRFDATNADTAYMRNKIRHQVLPLLREINPAVDSALTRLADNASADDDTLSQQLTEAIEAHVVARKGQITLSRQVFRAMLPALQRRYLLWSAQKLRSEQSDSLDELPVSYERVRAAVAAVWDADVGTLIELGGGLNLRVDYEQFSVEASGSEVSLPADSPFIESGADYTLEVPGSTDLGGWRFDIKREQGAGVSIRIQGESVSIRTRQMGDQFRVRIGREQFGTKPLSRWMVDAKIPRMLRERIPLLVIDRNIAAILWKNIVLNPDFSPGVDDDPKFLYHMSLVAY